MVLDFPFTYLKYIINLRVNLMDKRSYIQSKIMMFRLFSHFGESFYRDIVL